jgi:hypothetical protein
MRRSKRWTELVGDRLIRDEGSASIEFITVGILMLVPTVYLVLAMSSIQSASFAVEGAVRHAARVFVQAETVAQGQAAASRAIAVTLADYGLDADDAQVVITCRPNPADCLTRRGYVTVTITTVAPLPFFPAVLEADIPPGVPIDAVATEQVSRFAGS